MTVSTESAEFEVEEDEEEMDTNVKTGNKVGAEKNDENVAKIQSAFDETQKDSEAKETVTDNGPSTKSDKRKSSGETANGISPKRIKSEKKEVGSLETKDSISTDVLGSGDGESADGLGDGEGISATALTPLDNPKKPVKGPMLPPAELVKKKPKAVKEPAKMKKVSVFKCVLLTVT